VADETFGSALTTLENDIADLKKSKTIVYKEITKTIRGKDESTINYIFISALADRGAAIRTELHDLTVASKAIRITDPKG